MKDENSSGGEEGKKSTNNQDNQNMDICGQSEKENLIVIPDSQRNSEEDNGTNQSMNESSSANLLNVKEE